MAPDTLAVKENLQDVSDGYWGECGLKDSFIHICWECHKSQEY